MPFDFPTAPVVGDIHTEAGVEYQYEGNNVWNLAGGGVMTDYVLKAGDTMTGDLNVQASVNATSYVRSQRSPTESTVALVYGDATNCGRVEWINPDATRKAYLGYAGPTDLNLNLDSAERLNIAGGGISFGTQLGSGLDDISKGIEFYSGTNGMGISTSNGGQFNFVLKNAAHAFNFRMGAAGKMTINAAGATVVNGGLFVGDAWHGWAYSSADSCEHLRSYQGKFQFRKTNGSTPGTLQATLDNGSLNLTGSMTSVGVSCSGNVAIRDNDKLDMSNGYTMGKVSGLQQVLFHGGQSSAYWTFHVSGVGDVYTIDKVGAVGNSVNVTAPESFKVAAELGVQQVKDHGVDVMKCVAALLLKVKQLEAEIKTLKARK